MKSFLFVTIFGAFVCFSVIADQNHSSLLKSVQNTRLLVLDPSEATVNGNFLVAANWSELKRGSNILSMHITDKDNNPTTEATVKVVYDMVSMPMDPPDNPVKEIGKGDYEKEIFLGMRGKWKFNITVTKDPTEDTLEKVQNIK